MKGFISIWWSLLDDLYTIEIFTLYMFYKFVCVSSADNQATIKLLYNVETNLTSILSCSEGCNSLSWNSKYWISEIINWDIFFYTNTWKSSAKSHPTNWALLQWCEELNFHFAHPQWCQSCTFNETSKSYLNSTFNLCYTSLLIYHLLANNKFLNNEVRFYSVLLRSTQVSAFKNTFVSVR